MSSRTRSRSIKKGNLDLKPKFSVEDIKRTLEGALGELDRQTEEALLRMMVRTISAEKGSTGADVLEQQALNNIMDKEYEAQESDEAVHREGIDLSELVNRHENRVNLIG